MLDILNGMCERCLMNGLIQTLVDVRKLCDVCDRFFNNNYINDEEYSGDILYFYDLATKLHKNGHTSLEESYSIYSAILHADKIDFVETEDTTVIKIEPVKNKRTNKSNVKDGVVDISDIKS